MPSLLAVCTLLIAFPLASAQDTQKRDTLKQEEGKKAAATSPKLRGQGVALVKPSMDGIARQRSMLIWKREVPGAWLTHSVPKVLEADLPEGVAEDLSHLKGDS